MAHKCISTAFITAPGALCILQCSLDIKGILTNSSSEDSFPVLAQTLKITISPRECYSNKHRKMATPIYHQTHTGSFFGSYLG